MIRKGAPYTRPPPLTPSRTNIQKETSYPFQLPYHSSAEAGIGVHPQKDYYHKRYMGKQRLIHTARTGGSSDRHEAVEHRGSGLLDTDVRRRILSACDFVELEVTTVEGTAR